MLKFQKMLIHLSFSTKFLYLQPNQLIIIKKRKNKMMKSLKKILILIFIGILSFSYAQDMNEAGAKFNEGLEAMNTKNYAGAVKSLKASLDMCQLLGADAADLKSKVEEQLVSAYYKNGLTLYKGKKFDAAIAELKNAIKAAKAIGDNQTAEDADGYIPKVYSSKGLGMIKNKKYDEALKVFAEAIEYKENCVNAYYGQGLAYKEKDDIDQAIVSFNNALKYGKDVPEAAKTVKNVKSAAQKMLEASAAKELQIEHTSKAVEYLNASIAFGNKSYNTFYMLALAQNKLKNFDEAIDAANQGIEVQKGDASDILFEMGKAYEGKGDTAKACETYKKVVSGPNVKAAEYQAKEVLKCN